MEKERTGVLEVEGIPSKGLSLYDQSQQKFGELLNKNVSHRKLCEIFKDLYFKVLNIKQLDLVLFARDEIKLYNRLRNVNIIVFKLV